MSNQRLMKVKEKAGDGYAKTNAIAMAERRSVGTAVDNVVADRSCIAPGCAGATTTGMGGGDRRTVAVSAASRRGRNLVNIIPGHLGVAR